MKWKFATHKYAAHKFASGRFAGLGVGTALQPVCIDYKCSTARPFYKATKARPHFKAQPTRPLYAAKGQEKWS